MFWAALVSEDSIRPRPMKIMERDSEALAALPGEDVGEGVQSVLWGGGVLVR
jgi:hypothetical protein